MAEPSEELAAELEALRFTYGEHVLDIDEAANPLRVTAQLRPRGHEGDADEADTYVQASLVIAVPSDYPQHPPTCSLEGAKGLSDARAAALLAELRTAAADMHGELLAGRHRTKRVCCLHSALFCFDMLIDIGWLTS